MKKQMLICCVLLGFMCGLNAQTLVITDFTDWSSPSASGWVGDASGWSTSNPNTVTNQGAIGVVQYGPQGADLSLYEGGTFALNYNISALTSGSSGSFTVTMYDMDSNVIQTFSSTIALGVGSVTGTINTGNYENFNYLEIGTTGLLILPSQTFSGSFTNLSFTAIPEPSTYVLLMLGGAALVALRRKTQGGKG